MPIIWPQVKRGLDPMQYTIRTVPQLLKKSKAWSDYCDGERPPLEAIAKLAQQARLGRAA
jgi:bifunctional non-homologous end joining protein LigD